MSKQYLGRLSVVSLLLFVGCASPKPEKTPPDPRPLGKESSRYSPPERVSEKQPAEAPPPRVEEATGILTLRQALSLALMKNPQLAVFSWEVRAAEARALQAGLWPNPELVVELENFGGTGPTAGLESAEGTLGVSQLIYSFGKIKKRTQVARLSTRLAGWDYETVRVDVFTQVAKSFVSALSAQEQVKAARETMELAQAVYDTIEKQVAAGAVSPIESTRAKVELSTSRIDVERAERALEATRAALVATWGSDVPLFESAAGELTATSPIPAFSGLAQLVEQNPDVARWTTEMARREAELNLAKAEAYPDLRVLGGVRRLWDVEATAAVAAISVPLPLFNRNQGGIREAQDNLMKAEQQKRTAQVGVHSALSQAYQQLSAAYQEVTTLETETLPAAQSAFEAVRRGYTEGKFNYLDVLDTQRTLFTVRFRYITAQAAYHLERADVERLIGQPLDTPSTESN